MDVRPEKLGPPLALVNKAGYCAVPAGAPDRPSGINDEALGANSGNQPAICSPNPAQSPLYPEAETLVLAPVVTLAQKIAVAVVGWRSGVGKVTAAPPYTAAAGIV